MSSYPYSSRGVRGAWSWQYPCIDPYRVWEPQGSWVGELAFRPRKGGEMPLVAGKCPET